MAKSRAQKQETVNQLDSEMKGMKSVVFANFDGVKVKQVDALRKEARDSDVQMVVAKKTLLKKTLKKNKLDTLSDYKFEGGVASFFSRSDEVAGAQLVKKFGKEVEGLKMLGGIVDGEYFDESKIKQLASLPGKLELLGSVVGTIAAPLMNFMNVAAGPARQLVTVVDNIKKSKE
jgi:large subunit ribosomal protein L10